MYACHQSAALYSAAGIPPSGGFCLASDGGPITPVPPREEIPSAAPISDRVATGIIQMLPRAGPGDPRASVARGQRTFRASITLPTRYGYFPPSVRDAELPGLLRMLVISDSDSACYLVMPSRSSTRWRPSC